MFERGILSKGSSKLKVLFIVYFELKSGGPDKFMLSVKISFSIKGNRFFLFKF